MTVKQQTLKIGTRGSELAMTQTHMVRDALKSIAPDLGIEIVIIRTSGDWSPSDGENPLNPDAGGKALFAKEIEESLLSGAIDIAVHSMKDMDSVLPTGLQIQHMLPREDTRDCILFNNLSNNVQKMSDMSAPLKIGTSSVRRRAVFLAHDPKFKVEHFRGNVGTRIEKLKAGQVDATILAVAGLKRLGRIDEAHYIFDHDEVLSPAGQGAVGIETRTDDVEIHRVLDQITCFKTLQEVSAERSVLETIKGSCHTPIGVYAVLEEGEMYIQSQIWERDGVDQLSFSIRSKCASLGDAVDIGRTLGQQISQNTPVEWI